MLASTWGGGGIGGLGGGGGIGGIGGGFGNGLPGTPPPALKPLAGRPNAMPISVEEFAKKIQAKAGEGEKRASYAAKELDKVTNGDAKGDREFSRSRKPSSVSRATARRRMSLGKGLGNEVQAGKLGVDLSCATSNLRNQSQLTQNAQCRSATAIAWTSAASGSTRPSTPRCRRWPSRP